MADLTNTKAPLALGIPREEDGPARNQSAGAGRDDTPAETTGKHRLSRISLEKPVLPRLRTVFLIAGGLIFAFAALMALRAMDEARDRRMETELTQARISVHIADALDAAREEALVESRRLAPEMARTILADHLIGPKTAAYDVSADRTSYISAGQSDLYGLHPDDLKQFDMTGAGVALLPRGQVADGGVGRAMITWRPMSDGRTVIVLSPARDIFDRTPVWITFLLGLMVSLVAAGSIIALIRRQAMAIGHAADALKDARTRLEPFDRAGTGEWHVDIKAGLITLPAALMARLGLAEKDRKMVLREVSGLIHPKDARPVLSLWSGKSEKTGPVQFRLRQGARDWLWVTTTVTEADDKALSGLIMPLGQSPVDNGRAAKLQARLTDAIESIPEAFLLWDDQGRLVTWNRKFCNIFRIQPSRLRPGQSAGAVASLATDGANLITDHFAPPADGREQSLEVRLPGNRWGHVSHRRTQEGGWVCVVSNITDMKRRARAQKRKERELEMTVETLEQSRSELREAMHNYQIEKKRAEDANLSKSEFLANMSHELRTPLNAINGFSEVMQSELYGPLGHAKYKEYVDDILGSGRHLLALIDDILDMSKIEAGRMELNPGASDIERILNEGLRFVEPETRSREIVLNASIASLPSVWADQRATKQVFINLLSNAVKFTEEGGSVTVTAQADLDSVTVLIADTGIGISEERMAKLGEPFELVEDHLAKSRNGSGLGLALSKSLMEMQHGLLVIASEKHRGTVAGFTLPRRPGVAVKVPEILKAQGHLLTRLPDPAPDGLPLEQEDARAAE